MTPNSFRHCLTGCLFVAPLILGCSHAQTSHVGSARSPVAQAAPAAQRDIVLASHFVEPTQPVAQAPRMNQVVPPSSVRVAIAPVVEAAVSTNPMAPAGEQPVADTPAQSNIPVAASTSSKPPCFDHATDYSVLAGQVEYSRIAKGWRLRYMSCDESDCHGGSVTLMGDSSLATLKDGSFIRVRGHLSNPDDRSIAPPYRVEAVELQNAGN